MLFGSYSAWTLQNIIVRILVSTLLGSIIGLDRGMKHRGAGTKTNTIVCLGATLVMLTEQYIQVSYPGLANMTRMSAQVISGVGFLGVGTIMVSNHQVKGLTTAATLWACACVGLSVGIGFLDGGILITVLMLFALHVLPYVERFVTRNTRFFAVYLDVNKSQSIHTVIQYIKSNKLIIESMEIVNPPKKGQPISIYFILKTKIHMSNDELMDLLSILEEISSIDIL